MPATSPGLLNIENFESDIEQALMAYEPVRSSQVPLHLDVDSSGFVRLGGWVRSRVIKDSIEDIVRHVPGVAGWELTLVVDPELEMKVARALATSPKTASIQPGRVILRANQGTIRLVGIVPTAALAESVADVAEQVDGVRRVKNELSVAGSVGKK